MLYQVESYFADKPILYWNILIYVNACAPKDVLIPITQKCVYQMLCLFKLSSFIWTFICSCKCRWCQNTFVHAFPHLYFAFLTKSLWIPRYHLVFVVLIFHILVNPVLRSFYLAYIILISHILILFGNLLFSFSTFEWFQFSNLSI